MRIGWKKTIVTALVLVATIGALHAAEEHEELTGMAPQQALAALQAGNARFASGAGIHPHQDKARIAEVGPHQKPIAVVVSCSDSRVPPEIVFDQGLGDLFVIRCAGNIVTDADLGSVEYAVEHQGVRLIVVLGHQRCGAISVASESDHAPGHMDALVQAVLPAVRDVKGMPGDKVDNAVRANVRRVVRRIATSQPFIAPLVHSGSVQVVGAYYSLNTGKVSLVK